MAELSIDINLNMTKQWIQVLHCDTDIYNTGWLSPDGDRWSSIFPQYPIVCYQATISASLHRPLLVRKNDNDIIRYILQNLII